MLHGQCLIKGFGAHVGSVHGLCVVVMCAERHEHFLLSSPRAPPPEIPSTGRTFSVYKRFHQKGGPYCLSCLVPGFVLNVKTVRENDQEKEKCPQDQFKKKKEKTYVKKKSFSREMYNKRCFGYNPLSKKNIYIEEKKERKEKTSFFIGRLFSVIILRPKLVTLFSYLSVSSRPLH